MAEDPKQEKADEVAGDVDARRLEDAASGIGRGAPDRPAAEGEAGHADTAERNRDRELDPEC